MMSAKRHCTEQFPRHTEIVRLLAETQSVDLNLTDGRGKTPLHVAAQYGYTDMVKLLIEKQGVELNLRDEDGRTPLHTAAGNQYPDTVKLLVEAQGIELNLRDNYGHTPLSSALITWPIASRRCIEIVKVLIEKNNHVFDYDGHQRFPLRLWALSKGYIERAQCWGLPDKQVEVDKLVEFIKQKEIRYRGKKLSTEKGTGKDGSLSPLSDLLESAPSFSIH